MYAMNRRSQTTLLPVLLMIAFVACPVLSRTRKMQRIASGTWGGPHIQIEVEGNSATIEYDCAHGTIDGPLTIDSRGKFDLRGTHVRERGGPVRRDEKADSYAARYTGSIKGELMTLNVTLTSTRETLGTCTLIRGRQGEIFKCR